MNEIAEALRPHLEKVAGSLKVHLRGILGSNQNLDDAVAELNNAFVYCELQIIEKYLDLGMDPNLSLPGDHFPLTHLMASAVSGKWTDIAKFLILNGASPNVQDSKGVPVMFSLVSSGEVELVSLAISHGANLALRGKDGENAVLVAVHYKQVECLKELLKNGAEANISDKDGNSAVMWAAGRSNGMAMQRSLTCLRLLIDYGGQVNIANAKGFTPLMAATLIREVEAVKLLLAAGAKIEAQDNKGDTALLKAIDGNSEELVKLFIHSGANVNIQNKNGVTPLMAASSVIVLEELILAGGNVDAMDNAKKSVLHYQTDADQWENVRVLLEFGADHFVRNKNGETPLQIAIRRKNSRTIFLLIDAGSLTSQLNNKNVGLIHDTLLPYDYFNTINIFSKLTTPALWRELMFYTSQYRTLTHKLLAILLKNPENINLRGEGGVSPLMLAVGCGDLKAVKLLLKAGADPFIIDDGGRSALSYAAKAGNEEVAEILLRVGCNPNLVDERGCIPIYYAAFFKHMDIVLLLMLDLAFYYCFNVRSQIYD